MGKIILMFFIKKHKRNRKFVSVDVRLFYYFSCDHLTLTETNILYVNVEEDDHIKYKSNGTRYQQSNMKLDSSFRI